MKRVTPTLKKRIALNVFARYVKAQAQLHELSYFFWECTLRCNLSCLHCGSDCKQESGMKDMPYEDFLKVTAQVKTRYNPNKVMIVITGGEPLVRKDLEEAGLALYEQGFPWGIVTNGMGLTKERFQSLLKSGLRSITISLDGLEDSHDWLRNRKGSFQKAVEAIKLAVNEKAIIYDVVSCVHRGNMDELDALKEFLIALGVKKWRIFTIDPIGRAKEDALLNFSNRQFYELMEFIRNTRKENRIDASYGCDGFLGNYEGEVRDGFFFCRAGIHVGSVLADGSISACPNNSREVIQGNIYKDDFLEVWENKFQLMRDKSWAESGECTGCREFKWCHGNGLHLWDFDKDTVLRCHYKMLKDVNALRFKNGTIGM